VEQGGATISISSSKQQALGKCTVCERIIEHLTVIQASPPRTAPPPLHHPRTTQPQSVARSITVLPNQVLQDQRRLDTPCASRHSTPPATTLLSSPNPLPWSSTTCKHNNPFSTKHDYQTSTSRGQAHSQIHGFQQRSASCLEVNGRIHRYPYCTPNLRQLHGRSVQSIRLGSHRQYDGECSASACSMHG
jgi:hypothetical protein